MASRFFVEGTLETGATVQMHGADARKILTVLRMRDGDEIEIIDSAARRYRATIEVNARDVRAHVATLLDDGVRADALHVTVAQGVPKGAKMDYVVEKLTELGVSTIVPLVSERTIADVSPAKLERWRRLAKSAAQQCGRSDVPAIDEPIAFDAFLATIGHYDRALFPWELADCAALRESLPAVLDGARNVVIAIGPEGGFSHDEAEDARAAGATLISLGSRILRTETAALVLVAILNYLSE